MKKGKRTAVIASYEDIYSLCVFRGDFLEKIFFSDSKEKLIEDFEKSSVKGEVKNISEDKEKIEYCELILEKIKRKINKQLVR